MDYIKVPRELIFKNRDNLKDFGVQTLGTMNHQLFLHLKESSLMCVEGAMDIALQCFNNAYYICTLIQLEDFPELRVADYEKKLLEENRPFCDDICAISMAMVCELLPAYNVRWQQKDNELIRNIHYRFTHYQWMHIGASGSFKRMVDRCADNLVLPQSEFMPRNIIEAIEDVCINELAKGVEYVCERLAFLDDTRNRMYGADMATARLREELRKIYESWGYNPITKTFNADTTGHMGIGTTSEMIFRNQTEPKEVAIEYIENHYPSQKRNIAEQNILTDESKSPHEGEPNSITAQMLDTAPLESSNADDSMAQQLAEAQKTIEEYENTIKDLEDSIRIYQMRGLHPAKRKGIALGLTPIQAVIFGDYIAKKLKIKFGNKKEELSLILNCLFGHGISSLANKIGKVNSSDSKEDRLYVASILGSTSPTTAKEICSDWDENTPTPWESPNEKSD